MTKKYAKWLPWRGLLLAFLGLLLPLVGCIGNSSYAPVEEARGAASRSSEGHVVSAGETLFSIAWRYRIDFKRLAATNGINPPYTIYPGQRLRLSGPPTSTASKQTVTSGSNRSKTASTSSSSTAKSGTNKSSSTASTDFSIDRKRFPNRWQWPLQGRVIRSFTTSGVEHKGIDIQGKIGEPVHAANSGKVVYAGSGLVGYGKLLIVRHDDVYLSAYGHNSKLLVKEGDLVTVGDKIALLGETGTSSPRLHFEVRRNGQPLNPLRVLPKR